MVERKKLQVFHNGVFMDYQVYKQRKKSNFYSNASDIGNLSVSFPIGSKKTTSKRKCCGRK